MAKVVGCLGAGQLGRMLAEAANRREIPLVFLDVGPSCPAKQITANVEHVDGKFTDPAKIRELANRVDVLTVEIEHVNAAELQSVLDDPSIRCKEVHPAPSTIQLIQDKYAQKKHLVKHDLPVADFMAVGSETVPKANEHAAVRKGQIEGVSVAGGKFGFPVMLKSRTQAYDGRGNFVVKDAGRAEEAVKALGDGSRGLYAEKMAPFIKEVAVMVVRSSKGDVVAYPAVETIHKDNICHTVFAPLRAAQPEVSTEAQEIAKKAVATFEGAGVFGVEMFLMPDGELLINEIAPRPHNSGHYTIEACETSQYENQLLAILGRPLGSTHLIVPAAAMINILGYEDDTIDSKAYDKTMALADACDHVPGAKPHKYGKAGCKKGRKMGHVTVLAQSDAELMQKMSYLEYAAECIRAGAASQLRSAAAASDGHTIKGRLSQFLPTEKCPQDFSHPKPLVGIIMGSDSDLPKMLPAAEILKQFSIPFELNIVSAHRTPDWMAEYASTAPSRGLRVIIAGAGGAAHLPGMVAAQTPLMVIGVPVAGSVLDGQDSLLSIVQMPRGVPVATVAINNSTNAALLAVRLLGAADPRILSGMQRYMDQMRTSVEGVILRVKELGWDYTPAGKH